MNVNRLAPDKSSLVLEPFYNSLALLCWNKALLLASTSHVTSFKQSESIISTQHSSAALKIVYDVYWFASMKTTNWMFKVKQSKMLSEFSSGHISAWYFHLDGANVQMQTHLVPKIMHQNLAVILCSSITAKIVFAVLVPIWLQKFDPDWGYCSFLEKIGPFE